MVNNALRAQDVKRSGYCPKLSGQLVLTESINIAQCRDIVIDTSNRYTRNGFPLLSGLFEEAINTISEMDQMTVYFDKLVSSFMNNKDFSLLRPLYGDCDES